MGTGIAEAQSVEKDGTRVPVLKTETEGITRFCIGRGRIWREVAASG